jgi:hypothetical protein
MIYISPDNEYPRHIGDIVLAHPDFKEGDDLPDGWHKVKETQPPKPAADELVVEAAPKQVKGVWTQQWTQRPMTAEEIERRDAPLTARAKLQELGLTDAEIAALISSLR